MKNLKVTGKLKTYLEWPLALTLMWAAMVIILFLRAGPAAGFIGLAFTAVYFCICLFLFLRSSPRLMTEMIAFATQYGQVQKKLLKEFQLPYALLDEEGTILWMNDEFIELVGRERFRHTSIMTLFEEVSDEQLQLITPEDLEGPCNEYGQYK